MLELELAANGKMKLGENIYMNNFTYRPIQIFVKRYILALAQLVSTANIHSMIKWNICDFFRFFLQLS